MKKTILIVLIAVMIVTPCFAQEVIPESLFSIEGTLWCACFIGVFSIMPFIGIACGAEFGFYQGKIYLCTSNNCTTLTSATSSYKDFGVVSFAYDIDLPESGKWIGEDWNIFLAIMQPIGLGMFTLGGYSSGGMWSPAMLSGAIGIMFKIDNNWTPPEVE